MATVPSQMLWMLVKDWNCYQRKGPQNGAIFTSEPGNLYNKHSYKHSGLANPKNLHIASGPEGKVTISKGKKHTSHSRKQFPRLASSVQKDTKSYRPDLQKPALARLSAIQRANLNKKKAAK